MKKHNSVRMLLCLIFSYISVNLARRVSASPSARSDIQPQMRTA